MKRLLAFFIVSVLTLHAQITLVKDKTPQADIVFNAQSEKAAQALNDYLYKSAGTRLPVIKTAPTRAKIIFAVDPAMDSEAFKVQFPDASTIAITSGASDGLKIAVWETAP